MGCVFVVVCCAVLVAAVFLAAALLAASLAGRTTPLQKTHSRSVQHPGSECGLLHPLIHSAFAAAVVVVLFAAAALLSCYRSPDCCLNHAASPHCSPSLRHLPPHPSHTSHEREWHAVVAMRQ